MSNKQNDVFFMQILNNILKINNNDIIIVYDIEGNIWFGLRDIVRSLNYNNITKAITTIKISDNNKKIYSKLVDNPTPRGVGSFTNLLKPNKLFINESGLYDVLSKSKKPLAKIFMDKYFKEIMPSIRKTGKYIIDKESKKELTKINQKLKSIKKSNKNLLINQKNIDYPEGNHIYIIKQNVSNKTYYKIGYTKNLNKRIKTYNSGNVNKIYFNYIIKVEDAEIDKCIKKIMKNQEYIRNKEFYKVSLNNALKFIKKCNIQLNNISCGYCLKEYKFQSILKHKCQ
jgi:prophage antirepressor-like protein